MLLWGTAQKHKLNFLCGNNCLDNNFDIGIFFNSLVEVMKN